jgi:LAO/AO transport system kinase
VAAVPGEITTLASGVRAGDTRAVARAISLVEDEAALAQPLLAALFPHAGQALVVGVTGPPGAGKSSLVDRLTALLRTEGRSVGIVAVDPSSPFTGGAILGDRIRMQAHATDPGVFIRSMATRGHLGGLAATTDHVVTVLSAAGKDVVLVETVGVGQDEVDVAEVADTVILLQVPGLGDSIQTIKAGILEIADILVVNKSESPGAGEVVRDLRNMLRLGDHRAWLPPIVETVATEGKGIDRLMAQIAKHRAHLHSSSEGEERQERRLRAEVSRLARRHLASRVDETLDAPESRATFTALGRRDIDPLSAAIQVASDAARRLQQPLPTHRQPNTPEMSRSRIS